MPWKRREIENKLTGKFGFSEAEHRGSNHRWYELQLPGLPVVLTKVSHSLKEIGRALEGKIARQLRVTTAYFREMMSCSQERDDYYENLQNEAN